MTSEKLSRTLRGDLDITGGDRIGVCFASAAVAESAAHHSDEPAAARYAVAGRSCGPSLLSSTQPEPRRSREPSPGPDFEAAVPTITAILNTASFQSGPVAPGEIAALG
jgi:hypothetical protein